MKVTGIIRRIDDLGRVVIPKEIRRDMGICEGDPLEIFYDKDGSVIFKKYNEAVTYIDRIGSLLCSLENDYDFKCNEAVELLKQARDVLKNSGEYE